MLSVLIPARNEKYLEHTIKNVLQNARGEIEVLVALDGYLPDPQIHMNDDRVVFYHNPESIGQRQSVNMLARYAKGDYLMKLDAHCALGEGFDLILIEDYKEGEVHLPRMYNLDVNTFTPKLHKRTDYMYIGWNEKNQLRSLYYSGNEWKKWHRERDHILVDETMGIMGPCRFTSTKTFWDLGGCDESHGSWGSEGIEWACKAWLSGGRLVVNKKTWFAHWFRGSDGGFPYPMQQTQIDKARQYAENVWLQDKWPKQKRPFKWLVDKFSPPGWEHYTISNTMEYPNTEEKRNELQEYFYHAIHLRNNDPTWRGVKLIKQPTDIALYQMAIWDKKPDYIIEIGTAYCASALMFADFLEMTGKGHVISIDVAPRGPLIPHPRITYLQGDSKDDTIIQQIKDIVQDGSVMVSIDGDHHRRQVKWELKKYADIVTSGQYMVVEDCYGRQAQLVGPGEARDWFLSWNKQFKRTDFDARFIFGFTKGSWLLKK